MRLSPADLSQDIRYGLRRLLRNPGFTTLAVLALALGIGATCTIFSVVNAVLLRPLPFQAPDRLIAVNQTNGDAAAGVIPVSFTRYEAIRDQAKTLDGSAVYYTLDLSLGGEAEPELVQGARVSGDMFGLLGAQPLTGRMFTAEEDVTGGADVALITEGLWRRRFGGDRQLVGKTIRLDGRNVAVVGILPQSFRFPLQVPEPQVWLPRAFESDFLTYAQVHTGASYLSLVARLAKGVTLAGAQAELETIEARYRQQFPAYVDAAQFRLRASSLADSLVGASRASLFVLLGAVAFVLLIVCANVASLQLARASARVREMSVRKALGASPSRLVRQLLVESLALALLGGACGVALTYAVMPVVQRVAAGALPRLEATRVDTAVLLFSLGLCCATALVFGVVPALHSARGDLQEGLREGGRGASGGGARRRLRALFVAEAAVALVLVTGAGLLIRSLSGLTAVDPGLTSHGVTIVPITLPVSRYAEPARQAEFFHQLLERVEHVPGVTAAGATSALPLSGGTRVVFFCPEGRECLGLGKDPVIAMRQVTPGYFTALQTRIVRGRAFKASDTAESARVVIVNETTVKRHWPGIDPIGKHLANSRDKIQREVVGVASDTRFRGLDAPAMEEMYLPLAQNPWPAMTVAVRSDKDPRPLVAALRQEVASLDADVAVAGVRALDDVVGDSVAQPQLIMRVVTVFAALALLLACMGIYGVMAYSVAERTREFGVRMALGAGPREILGLVLKEGMGLTLLGVGLGLAASLALTRLIASQLFGVGAADPLTYTAAIGVLAATALVACYVPARRGMRLAPVQALREE